MYESPAYQNLRPFHTKPFRVPEIYIRAIREDLYTAIILLKV